MKKEHLTVERLADTCVFQWRRNAIQYLLSKPLDVKGEDPFSIDCLVTYSHMIYILYNSCTNEPIGYAKIDSWNNIQEFEIFREYRKQGYGTLFVELLQMEIEINDIDTIIDNSAIFWWKALGSEYWILAMKRYIQMGSIDIGDKLYDILSFCSSSGHGEKMTTVLLSLCEMVHHGKSRNDIEKEILSLLSSSHDTFIYGWNNIIEIDPYDMYMTKRCIDALLSKNIDDIKLLCETKAYECIESSVPTNIHLIYKYISNGGNPSAIIDEYLSQLDDVLKTISRSIDRLYSINYKVSTLYIQGGISDWKFSTEILNPPSISISNIRIHRRVLRNRYTYPWYNLCDVCWNVIHPDDIPKMISSIPSSYLQNYVYSSNPRSQWIKRVYSLIQPNDNNI